MQQSPLEALRTKSYITREGVNLLGISDAAENIGFRTLAVKSSLQNLIDHTPFPCVLHWNQNDFVVLYKVKNKGYSIFNSKFNTQNSTFYIAGPGHGLKKLNERDFLKSWQGKDNQGIALLLEPTESFYTKGKEQKHTKEFRFPS